MSALPSFSDPTLLTRALTHKSYCNEHPSDRLDDNQRLEFLGDAALGFLVGELLYRLYPDLPEGELTRRRSALVDQPSLANLAIALQIGAQMRIGKGVEREHGRENPSLLSDTFEAIIGAYFLDAGVDAVQAYVAQLFTPQAQAMQPHAGAIVDPKSLFQQYALAQFGPENPRYRVVSESGPDHAKLFTVEVLVGDRVYGQGRDRSKREAEKRAAADALRQLQPLEHP